MQVYTTGIVSTSTASWKKNSSIVISFSGCDFRCGVCNTPELVDFKQEFLQNILDVKREINKQASLAEVAIFTGGEPCLQRQALLSIARHCKEAGLDVGLETNGSKPEAIVSLLRENLLDFIEVDLKAPFDEDLFEKMTSSKNFFNPTNAIMQNVKETIKLLKKHEKELTVVFKTTIIPGLTDEKELLSKIGEEIKDLKCTWRLVNFSPVKTLKKEYASIVPHDQATIEFLKEELRKKYSKLNIE